MLEVLKDDELFESFKTQSIRRRRISQLLNRVMNGEFRHKELFPMTEIDSVSLAAKYMRKLFRGKGRLHYKLILDHYFDCVNSTYQFFKKGKKGKTRKYRLKDWVVNGYMDFYRDTTPFDLTYFSGRDVTPLESIPSNAVYDLDKGGNPRASTFILPPTIEVNLENINKTIDGLENYMPMVALRRKKQRTLIHLYQWRKALHNTLTPNKIVQLYRESDSGRLSPPSGMNFPNIINAPSKVREVMFSDMGLVSYDMANAHFSVFNGLCNNLGMKCKNLEKYLANKVELREEWSEKYWVRKKPLKQYLISWLYGNGNNAIQENPLYKKVGEEGMVGINQDPTLSGIYKEIVKGRKLIVEAQRNQSTITNILGKTAPTKTLAKDLCFLLFGYETMIMQEVNSLIGSDMICYIYDGWIGRKMDVEKIQNAVNKKLNLNITFDEEPIILPTPKELC